MSTEKWIAANDLMDQFSYVLNEIHRHNIVYIVRTMKADEGFVLTPSEVGEHVLRGDDPQDKGFERVDVDSVHDIRDVSPRRGRHPVFYRGDVCLAHGLSIEVYDRIRWRRCPECGNRLSDQATFCLQCGAHVEAGASPVQQEPEVKEENRPESVTDAHADPIGDTRTCLPLLYGGLAACLLGGILLLAKPLGGGNLTPALGLIVLGSLLVVGSSIRFNRRA